MGEYTVVRSRDLEELENMVNDLMEKGWVPQGGLAEMRSCYWQAMVRIPGPDGWQGGPR